MRVVNNSQNNINKGIRHNNTSGYTGVHWYSRYNQWCVRIGINGKRILLGYFDNIKDAITVRKEAEIKYFGEYRYQIELDAINIKNQNTLLLT
jgi:hypothetical protein